MSIPYIIVPNPLPSSGEAPYLPRAVQRGKMTLAQISEQISYSSSLAPGDIAAVLQELRPVIVRGILAGLSVDLGFVMIFAQLRGATPALSKSIKKKQNPLSLKARLKKDLQKEVQTKARFEKRLPSPRAPECHRLYNYRTQSYQKAAMPADILRLDGSNLIFGNQDEACGLFLTDSADSKVQRIETYGKRTKKYIDFQLPAATKNGHYRLLFRKKSARTEDCEEAVLAGLITLSASRA